jgi:pyruvate-formate lyase
MAHINIDGAQNVNVSKEIPCQKSWEEQLDIMEAYTDAYKTHMHEDKAFREIRCLETIFPTLFRSIEPQDKTAGRLDFLPIGFGSVTSIGGVGHYCVFHKLRAMKDHLDAKDHGRIDALYDFWQEHDVKTIYCQDVLNEDTTGRFIDCTYPFMATARLSGMMLDYEKLMKLGIDGLQALCQGKDSPYMQATSQAMDLFRVCVNRQIELVAESEKPQAEKEKMTADLQWIAHKPPETFSQALQLFWLYALLAGCINYGRMDVVLGPYLKADLDAGRLTETEAIEYLKSLWMLIENRRTTVNGRIIVGGRGRKDEEAADLFCRLCLKVCAEMRTVEPQFTLRFDKNTPADIMDAAYECIAAGATYPTLYNDDVNIPAVMHAMRVDRETAEQYVPFGCGEFVIQGQSVGTPNTLLNLVKILQIAMNEGIDPMDGKYKAGPVKLLPLKELDSWEAFYGQYKALLDYYFDLSVYAQKHSYEVMNQEVSFLFVSALMQDCLGREKALLDGGVKILGGTNETYGNINASDALYAVKTLAFDQKKYTLDELNAAALADFAGYETLQKEILSLPKYGNDQKGVDDMADDLYEYVAKGIRQRGIDAGMGYYLIVISNNQTNTDWGHETDASLDGRNKGVFMNPANNPQGGQAKSGPTAVLNSLARFDAKWHGGSVQNIKFTPRMMHEDKEKVKLLFDTYFEKGGCQLMVTVVDHGVLEDAQKHPEKYPDLIVRVAGYSAVFVDLTPDVQAELLTRTLYD